MNQKREETTILIAEDDPGHAVLIKRNLNRAGLKNPILRFEDGQKVLDFLFLRGTGAHRDPQKAYLLLLDIRLPRVDGIEVLRQVKQHPHLRKLPVIMLTTTENPCEIDRCHSLGCNNYIVKPVDYNQFAEAIQHLGIFLPLLEVPQVNGPAAEC